ncbi:MAG: radical SAM protein, partial [Candidatus Thermoplasmatota archaeon]|nr:radical SAM protein [Candidatus Thermoplasmatota archaeon]
MDQEDIDVGEYLSRSIELLLDRGAGLLGDGPPDWLLDLMKHQMEFSRRRAEMKKQDVHVPPFMIMSVTRRCNLNCAGCYARELHGTSGEELEDVDHHSILEQAEELGIGIILTAGGEPLLREGLLDLLGEHSSIIFPLFTNGLLLNDQKIEALRGYRNIVPVLSIEGFQGNTDVRRGEGVLENILRTAVKLKEKDIFWGTSITFTSENVEEIASDEFV